MGLRMDGARGVGIGVVKGDVELMEGVERIEDAFVGVGEVELVVAIVFEEEGVGEVL